MKTFFTLFIIQLSLFASNLQIIRPIEPVSYDAQKAELGKRLFSDVRLSRDNTVSCETCHRLLGGGVDSLQYSFGVGGAKGTINAPTVLNSAYNFVQFWDGRAKNLHEQAKGPILNPIEMASSPQQAVAKISSDAHYAKVFAKLYKQGVTMETIADAIAHFEMALTTPNSRFDRYLKGNESAISEEEKQGYELFRSKGCISCHNGMNIGGNMFQKFGIFAKIEDQYNHVGRYAVTKKEKDRYYFKVPSLRNVAMTAPYFHTGSAATLEDAIGVMSKAQLGTQLGGAEIAKIAAFLRTLNGERPLILESQRR